MDISERLKNLENYAYEKEMKEKRKIEKERQEEIAMINSIKSLKSRIDDLLLVANSCLSNGISIESREWNYMDYKHGNFVADAVTHHLGFSTYGEKTIHYLEIRGGGYDHYNLKTDGCIVDVQGEKLYVLKRFLNEFDEFESEFYAYVDKFIDSHSIKSKENKSE